MIRILDHLTLALVLGVVLANRAPMMAAMWLAAGSRTLSDVLASPVRMRFPLAVHLAVMRWTVEWEDVVRSLLMFLQIVSTGGRSLSVRFQWARSTMMLWVEGLALAIAEKFFDGVLGGGVLYFGGCSIVWGGECLLDASYCLGKSFEGGTDFFKFR